MAITFEGVGALATGASSSGNTAVNIPWPTGYTPLADDFAVIVCVGRLQTAATNPPLPTQGFSQDSTVLVDVTDSTSDMQTTVFTKKLTGSESVPQFTNNNSTTVYGSRGIAYRLAIFRGVDSSTAIDASAVTSTSGQATSFTPTGVATTYQDTAVLSIVGISDDNTLSLSTSQGFSLSFQSSTTAGDDMTLGLAFKRLTTSGSVTNPTWQYSSTGPDDWACITLALKAAPPVGSINVSELNDTTTTIAGTQVEGSLSETQDDQTLSSSAFFGVSGSLSVTEGSDTLSSEGFFGWRIFVDSIDGADAIEGVPGTRNVPGADVVLLEDEYLYIDSSDGRIPPLGPENITLFDPLNPPSPYIPRVTARLIAANGSTVLSNLTNAFGIEWREALNEHGFGKISVPASEADADLLVPGRFIQCLLDEVPRFLWMIEAQPERVVVSSGEESDEVVTAQGRGWIALLDYALVYPEKGTSDPLNPQHRIFSFASPSFPNFNTLLWRSSVPEGRAGQLLPPRVLVSSDEIVEPAPGGFPDPNAQWIWGTAKIGNTHRVGFCYFKSSFTNPRQQELRFVGSADNFFAVFLDGTPIFGENSEGLGWQGFKEVVLLLPAGTYTIGIVGENISGSGGNPAGVLLSIFPNNQPPASTAPAYPGYGLSIFTPRGDPNVGLVQARLNQLGYNSGPVDNWYGPVTQGAVLRFQANNPPLYQTEYAVVWQGTWTALFGVSSSGVVGKLLATSSSFRCLPYPVSPPGWTPGQIVRRLLSDASSRGILVNTLAATFGSFSDSSGRSWSSGSPNFWSYIPSFSIPIGSTVLSAIDSLAESGWIDYRMTPGVSSGGIKKFDMFNANTVGQTKNIVYTYDAAAPVSIDVVEKSINNNVVTLTTRTTHGIASGTEVTVAGVGAPFDGTFTVVQVPTTTMIRYNLTASNVSPTSATGTVTSNVPKNANIRSLTYDIGEPKVNRIVVKWSKGWIIVNNSSNIATYGAYERFLTVDTEDQQEAIRQAQLNLAQLSDPQHAIVLEVEPRESSDETPYRNFSLGDKVYAPSPAGVSTAYRVMAISVQQDDMGNPLFTLELNRRSRIIERQQFELLQTLSGGVAGPNSTRTLEATNPASAVVRSGGTGVFNI